MRTPGSINGKYIAPTSTITQGKWNAAEQYGFNINGIWTNVSPVMSGLVGMYTADTVSGNTWYDISGNNNHATLIGSGHSIVTTTASTYGATKSFKCIQGDRNSAIIWPSGILPSTYTLFYVARYNTSNSSTAATLLNYQSGSTTSGGLTGGTGGGTSTTSVNGEWKFSYNSFETSDSIWAGEYILIDNSGITANNSYIVTVEGRSDNAFLTNGTSGFYHEWDSSVYSIFERNTPVMKTDRQFSTVRFTSGTTFALGNRWIRGMNKNGLTYGSTTNAYFRNWYAYRVSQLNLHTIFTGYDRSWYSGFWAGHAGSAYHGNVMTIANTHSNNWVLGVDQNNGGQVQFFRTNKVDRYNSTVSNMGTSHARLSINPDNIVGSNYQVAEVIVYNRTLSTSEYQSVENYLSSKYGVA